MRGTISKSCRDYSRPLASEKLHVIRESILIVHNHRCPPDHAPARGRWIFALWYLRNAATAPRLAAFSFASIVSVFVSRAASAIAGCLDEEDGIVSYSGRHGRIVFFFSPLFSPQLLTSLYSRLVTVNFLSCCDYLVGLLTLNITH